MDLIQATNRD